MNCFTPVLSFHTIQERNICIFQVFQDIVFSQAAWLHTSNKSAQKLNLEYAKGGRKKHISVTYIPKTSGCPTLLGYKLHSGSHVSLLPNQQKANAI